MDKKAKKNQRNKARTRYKLRSVSKCGVRLSVFKSDKNMYAQIIDDSLEKTLCSASTLDTDIRGLIQKGGNVEAAKVVGTKVADKALAAGVKKIVFDRGGFVYHGRIKALADAAREAGLDF